MDWTVTESLPHASVSQVPSSSSRPDQSVSIAPSSGQSGSALGLTSTGFRIACDESQPSGLAAVAVIQGSSSFQVSRFWRRRPCRLRRQWSTTVSRRGCRHGVSRRRRPQSKAGLTPAEFLARTWNLYGVPGVRFFTSSVVFAGSEPALAHEDERVIVRALA